ncbi:MAG: hypothetical protein GXX85_08830 [Ignavibacteria bacterium]|nr:hypothetical protein [Ignavibacteria bacterium]
MSNYYSLIFHFSKIFYQTEKLIENKIELYEIKNKAADFPYWKKLIGTAVSEFRIEHFYKLSLGTLYITMLTFLILKYLQ